MATNLKSDGLLFDANLIIATGATITAGSLIFCDVSGTNVVRAIRQYSGTTVATDPIPGTGGNVISLDGQLGVGTGVFLGVIANTQTGLPNHGGGSQTGVTWYNKGVFEFDTTPTASSAFIVGVPVYAIKHDTVRTGFTGINAGLAGSNITGSQPIGVVSFLPRGPVATNTVASRVRVKIFTDRSLPAFA